MKKAAVLGHPIAHSKSPLIHNYWMKKYGIEGHYEAVDVPPENFEHTVRTLFAHGYSGLNVTVPHKETAAALADETDELVRYTGAANTFYMREGVICATNTDVFGFAQNIKDAQPGFDFTDGPAVVLGAGGAARAVVHALIHEGAPEIHLLNRSRERAEILTESAKDPARITVFDWDERSQNLDNVNLLVNTTALGMDGKPPLDTDLSGLPKTALVNDIVYAPLYTALLEDAKARGNITVTGVGMLLHQARKAFECWFDVLPDIDEELTQMVLK